MLRSARASAFSCCNLSALRRIIDGALSLCRELLCCPFCNSLPHGHIPAAINMIDKSLSHRHSCRAVAGKHHSCFGREKTRKEAALDACPFRVFQNSRLFNSHRLFGSKKLCVAQMSIIVPMSTFSIPKKLGSQLSKSHRRENHL